MRFLSTRSPALTATFSQTVRDGLAPDGGLYVPERLPTMGPADFPQVDSLASIARSLLLPFASADPLEVSLAPICDRAFDFPAPLVRLEGTSGPASVLELFHGPTCAFKDFGARFLAACLERVHGRDQKLTVLVATSGDTGAAVAAAFHRAPWADVVLLYPKGLVSPRQAQQLACWGANVRTFAVLGTFDDCQRMVKSALGDPDLSAAYALTSANSISLGRLLPQMVYYAQAALEVWRSERSKPNFIVPAGNLGNAAACLLAREIGLPIGDILLATNENRVIPDYLESGEWRPRAAVPTLASAMDVGSPSNMERLRWWFKDVEGVRGRIAARSVSDAEIRVTIQSDASALGYLWCPHSATAAHVYSRLGPERRHEHWIIVATAHPAKFNDIIEPLIGRPVAVPRSLSALLELPRQERDLAATDEALRFVLNAS
jgi:threonine synthase